MVQKHALHNLNPTSHSVLNWFNGHIVSQVLDDSTAMLKTLWTCRHTNSALFDAVERALHGAKPMGTDKLARRDKGLFSSSAWCSIFRMIAIVASIRYVIEKGKGQLAIS